MPRLVVVSNRVAPIEEGQPTSGGLAAGVLDALRASGGIWFGWSGEITEASQTEPGPARQVGPIALHTIGLGRADYDGYYRGFANGTLWPTLHYQIGLARFAWDDYAAWQRVNAAFARAIAALLRPDDLIWAHDYHLFGLAEALRALGVRNRMGLFVHTPFPPPTVLMTVPAHEALVRAMADFDLIGFQTETDRVAFDDYLVRHADGRVIARFITRAWNRTVRTEVYPIGVDVPEIVRQVGDPAQSGPAAELIGSLGACDLVLSVDRLDYSKGLRARFQAYEAFLEARPERRGRVTFLQIAPPSRDDIDTYREIRRELEGEAGRINGRFAELGWVPLRYLNRGFPRTALMPIYRAARIGLVTPVRDGMNLVAKEYVAAQDPADPGVLVLSEFAGAAQEMTAALLVNPYDRSGMADALERGLAMPRAERIERHRALLDVLGENTLARWRDRFVADLASDG
jgi:trehalose 6-phosphate synthase